MFKTLLKQIGDYRKDAILTPVFVILEVVKIGRASCRERVSINV